MNKSSIRITVILTCFLPMSVHGDESVSTTLESVSVSSDASAKNQVPYRLTYRFSEGRQFRFRTIKTATTEAMWQENRKTDETETEEHRRFTVLAVREPQIAEFSMQFEYVRLQSRTNGGPWERFDTRMTPSEIPGGMKTIAEQLKGRAPKFLIQSDGRCVAPGPQENKTGSYSRESFLIALPDHDVRIGDTWSQIQQAKVRLNKEISRQVEILQTYRLVSVRDGIAEISMNASLTGPSLSPQVRAQLIQSTPRGTLHFDLNRGFMVRKQWRFDELVINAMGENTALRSFGTYLDEYIPETAEGTEIQPVSATDSGVSVVPAAEKSSETDPTAQKK